MRSSPLVLLFWSLLSIDIIKSKALYFSLEIKMLSFQVPYNLFLILVYLHHIPHGFVGKYPHNIAEVSNSLMED